MSIIDPAGPAAAASAAAARSSLGQADFIRLMLAQFRNQDPLKPLESTEFLSQLAEFSTVAGIDEMNGSLGSLTDSMRSDRLLAGASLVGREVLVNTNRVVLPVEGAARCAVEVPPNALSVVVTVADAAGQVVAQSAVPAGAGIAEFTWDGATSDGGRAAPGEYRISAVANVGGAGVSLAVMVADQVRSVTVNTGTGALELDTANQGTVPLADVRRIG